MQKHKDAVVETPTSVELTLLSFSTLQGPTLQCLIYGVLGMACLASALFIGMDALCLVASIGHLSTYPFAELGANVGLSPGRVPTAEYRLVTQCTCVTAV